MRPHERLDVWQDAMLLVEHVYRLSSGFPHAERFGLVAQMRRAAISIPSNISEGAARRSTLDYLRYLSIARGSLAELDTQIQIAARLGFGVADVATNDLLQRTFARLNALIHSLEFRQEAPRPGPIPNPESPIPC